MKSIPEHLLNDIEDYEGEFEDFDDYGGGRTQFWIKTAVFCFSIILVALMVMIVFFPRATEQYLGFRPPHLKANEPDPDPYTGDVEVSNSSAFVSPVDVTETTVASGIQDLREEREQVSFGGLYLPTNPNGATVVVGDMEPGLSPIKLPNIEPGTYDVAISKDGYETHTLTITIEPKEVKRVDTVVLRRLP
ncbi:PEGA domain-containing protein [Opitutia bacterium ISCC 51]|nr:PEGA domain-containing protein [Opitutae bacterium ISCC 51]QXD28046.1 PEGA domain-containing protein [Opitutae bacterium ISCC 52]